MGCQRNYWALAAAFGLAALVALFWLFGALSDTFRHIMPGEANMASTSMEPYDLYFRTNYKSFKPLALSSKPMEWHLRIPRAYVTRQLGSNGAIELLGKVEGNGNFFLDLQANLDSTGESFVPSVTLQPDQNKKYSLFFHLINTGAPKAISAYGSCVPQHLEKEIMGPRGFAGASNTECTSRDLRCKIHIHSDGWHVDLAVTHELYANPERACALAHQFLDKYTVSRDDIR